MKTKFFTLTILAFTFFACQTDNDVISIEESALKEIPAKQPSFVDLGNTEQSISTNSNSEYLAKSSETRKVAIYMAEYITAGDSGELGNVVFFMDNGNKQLDADFVPGWAIDGTDNISYYVDDNRPSEDLPVSVSNNAIDRAMNTWDGVTCSDIGMFERPFNKDFDPGFVARTLSDIIFNQYGIEDYFGGSYDYFADVTHVGWMDGLFFDFIAENGSQYILGVTFTIIWVGQDADNNGKDDVAWREIYYNDAFTWDDGATFDVETIALHEAGHGLSQAHFGKAFGTYANQKIHFAPRSVMNATYTGVQTSIEKTDKAGHCSNWAQWPHN
ncbi:MAG: hypothetical protein ABFS12_18565 [Bacteroidota bacterium]